MLGPMIGVLFDGFAYGMLLFLLSVGLSVTLGMMNFVNLAHCAFAMLGGYVTVTLMNSFGWPFLATLPIAFLAAALVSVVLRAHALPPALSRERSRSGAAHHRARLHVGRGRGLSLRHDPAAGADAVLSARLGDDPRASTSASIACSWSSSRWRSRSLLVAGARIHPLRRAGARRGRQPAHGARARHQCRRRIRGHLRARQRACRAWRRARDRDRRARSVLRASPISSMC